MRIAILNWSCRTVGGAEVYLDTIFTSLHAVGYQLAFLYEVDAPQNYKKIWLPETSAHWAVSDIGRGKAIEALRAWHPDLIYTHTLRAPGLEAEVLKVAPAVLFSHDYSGTCISGDKTFKFPIPTPCNRAFGWKCLLHYYPHRCGGLSPVTMRQRYWSQSKRLRLLRRYSAILTASDRMRDEYLKHGFPPEKVYKVQYFVPTALATRYSAFQPREPKKRGWRLLFVGRMEPLKGGLTLLESLPRIVRTLNWPIRMTFAGAGTDQERWQKAASHLQAREKHLRIEFTGWLEKPALEALFDDSDLLVVPSLWPEPFGRVGIEAGLRGLPAAAFAVGGIPEWLLDGVNGHLAPGNPPNASGLADAVIKCLRNPAEHARLRQGATEIASRFTLANHMVRLSSVFNAVANCTVQQAPAKAAL